MIDRTLKDSILPKLGAYPAIAVTGPRQSGKTVCVRATFPKMRYLSLEDPDTREMAENDPRYFLAGFPEGGIIDEIQRVPHILSYLQTIIDSPSSKANFVLTGSNQFLLMKHVSQSLAGRILILRQFPFTLTELAPTSWNPSTIDHYLYTGAYPRIYDKNLNPTEWYLSYIETYLEKDLKDFIQVSDLSQFRRLLAMLASMCGQLLNLSSLGATLGITHNTVKAWIAALEHSQIIFLLQPFYRNFGKRIVKTPKVYFWDTGLACALLRITESSALTNHFIKGHLFENCMIAELRKEIAHRNLPLELFFWRDHTGHEIDCLFERNGKIFPVEIKASQTISQSFFKNIIHYNALAGDSVMKAALIYGGAENQERSNARIVPWRSVSNILE